MQPSERQAMASSNNNNHANPATMPVSSPSARAPNLGHASHTLRATPLGSPMPRPMPATHTTAMPPCPWCMPWTSLGQLRANTCHEPSCGPSKTYFTNGTFRFSTYVIALNRTFRHFICIFWQIHCLFIYFLVVLIFFCTFLPNKHIVSLHHSNSISLLFSIFIKHSLPHPISPSRNPRIP